MNKLFVCYHSQYRAEVDALAQALRLRGIAPWVDCQGGLTVGQQAPTAARHVLRHDCWGLLLYATRSVFEREFVRYVEIAEGLNLAEHDKAFVIIAVPRGLSFEELKDLSSNAFGQDLSVPHSCGALADLADSATSDAAIESRCREVAREVLASRLSMIGSQVRAAGCLRLRVSSRAPALAQEDDLLHVDGSQLFAEAGSVRTSNWERALAGLVDLRAEISRTVGEVYLRIQGRLHLSLAVALGWVFRSPSGFEFQMQQGQEMWATGLGGNVQHGLVITPADGTTGKGPLFVEVSATHAVGAAVRELVSRGEVRPTAYIRVQPASGPARQAVVGNASCCAMAKGIGDAIVGRCSYGDISEIHLFIAAPQALAVMVGRELNALPPIQLYEWDGLRYDPSIRLAVADLDT